MLSTTYFKLSSSCSLARMRALRVCFVVFWHLSIHRLKKVVLPRPLLLTHFLARVCLFLIFFFYYWQTIVCR